MNRFLCLLLAIPVLAQTPPKADQYAEYLFTHMITSDYGRLYYSLSKDGLHFTRINGGKRENEEYRGHTCVTSSHDGRYYMTGGGTPAITFWVSADLVRWEKYGEHLPELKRIPILAKGPAIIARRSSTSTKRRSSTS